MRPLVFLHGYAHSPSAWRPVLAALAPSGWQPPVLCPVPGHDPAWPVGADWDETIAGLSDRLPPGAIAVGYSLGARVALGLLARDAMHAAILIGVNPGLEEEGARAARREADQIWIDRLRREGMAGFVPAWEAQPIFARGRHADPEERSARAAARMQMDPEGLARAMEVLGLGAMPPLAEALVARAARAQLIVGAEDGKFRQLAEALAARAPALGPMIVDGSGHDPTLEQPAATARAIAAALARWR